MKAARLTLLALTCLLPLAASAQWQWLDKDGRKVFSDKAPPPEIAPERILKGPKGHVIVPDAKADAAPAAVPVSTALPKPTGSDKALEERKSKAAAAEAEQKKAEEAKVAAAKAENCNRARANKASYDSGVRMMRVDAKGERQFIDDNQKAEEVKRLNEVIARDCAQ
jgi:Domain of unknown function (DUF4124)